MDKLRKRLAAWLLKGIPTEQKKTYHLVSKRTCTISWGFENNEVRRYELKAAITREMVSQLFSLGLLEFKETIKKDYPKKGVDELTYTTELTITKSE